MSDEPNVTQAQVELLEAIGFSPTHHEEGYTTYSVDLNQKEFEALAAVLRTVAKLPGPTRDGYMSGAAEQVYVPLERGGVLPLQVKYMFDGRTCSWGWFGYFDETQYWPMEDTYYLRSNAVKAAEEQCNADT